MGFLIGAAIGSGSNALAAEHGGADFLLAINAGRFRNMGVPSIACMLPVYDANSITESFAKEELLALCKIPVLLGTNVWGASFDPVGKAKEVYEAGFAGAVNFPSCLHYSRPMQQILSRAGRGIEQEVELLRAVQDTGLTAMFYCASRTQARLAADAGIDMICLNIGWNAGGVLGHISRSSIEEVAVTAREIGRLVKRINPNSKFLVEGGPIATPEDLSRVLELAPLDGYVGGSTIDRMPLESSVASLIDGFRQASSARAGLKNEDQELIQWADRFGFVGHSVRHLAMLRRLQQMAVSRNPVLIVAEPGQSTGPVIKVLGGAQKPGTEMKFTQIDVAEQNFPARARNVLFGHRDSISRQKPVLSDDNVNLVVIHTPERLTGALQRRLARALQDGFFQVSGSRKSLPLEPRIVFLSHLSVRNDRVEEDLLAAGLEPELLSCISGWTLRLPPLRDRLTDLQAIIDALSEQERKGSTESIFSSAAIQKLRAYHWPGNEQELLKLIGSLKGRPSKQPVQPEELVGKLSYIDKDQGYVDTLPEKDRIVEALWRNGFNRGKTAAALGMSRKTLYNKIKKFELSG
ncbi:MAG: phosphoenolpyruvate hydrolase family protein [Proteobacteria bacterium]|nr:phosphoenolpyruvate hydrolase family protein [Pseudomonadota bacterium]